MPHASCPQSAAINHVDEGSLEFNLIVLSHLTEDHDEQDW